MSAGSSNAALGRAFRWKIASRVNSFRRAGLGVATAIRRMAEVRGVSVLELNYPQHFLELAPGEMEQLLSDTGLRVTALNLRFEGPQFARGAFSSPDHFVRNEAIRLASEAVDVAKNLGADHVVLWMADDGWDYPFQVDYGTLWDREIEGFRIVADRDPSIRVSVEYKPFEPRRFSLIRSMSDALRAVSQVNRDNFGVTLDMCHAYMAGEHPPASAAAALREGKLFGVHLNDGHGVNDDGLMIAAIHERDTLELLHILREGDYRGTLYFDTFPMLEDPAAELAANITELARLERRLDQIDMKALRAAQDDHDAIGVSRAVVGN